jgi:hypothetical protein
VALPLTTKTTSATITTAQMLQRPKGLKRQRKDLEEPDFSIPKPPGKKVRLNVAQNLSSHGSKLSNSSFIMK